VGDAGILVNPAAEEDIFSAILMLSESNGPRVSLVERGREQAKKFTWESAARGVLECYRACTR